mmetsp:Transcript_77386/g.116346  ORF Transcript_77386/g.116346 Transcript_77386/m.116346 type:complete len:371 (+) Transcript_77386:123-1235(+)
MATSPLRSRVYFPELNGNLFDADSSRGLESEEEASDEEFTYALYESPCTLQASNEEFTSEQIDAFEVCDTTFYGRCLEEPPDTDDAVAYQIAFDFELWHRRLASVSRTLEHLEPVMLDHVASVLGLKDCPTRQRRRRRLQGAHDLTDEELDLLVGISSAPGDFEDEDFDECHVPVGREGRGAICVPATGIMTIYLKDEPSLTNEKVASISSGIERLVRFGMSADIYLGGNTKFLSFIGTRAGEGDFDSFREPKADGLQGAPDGTVGNPNRTAGIVGGIAGCFLLVAILLFIVAGRKREEQKLDQDFVDAIIASEESGGSRPTSGEVNDTNPWLDRDNAQRHPDALQKKTGKPPIDEVVAQFDPDISNISL